MNEKKKAEGRTCHQLMPLVLSQRGAGESFDSSKPSLSRAAALEGKVLIDKGGQKVVFFCVRERERE